MQPRVMRLWMGVCLAGVLCGCAAGPTSMSGDAGQVDAGAADAVDRYRPVAVPTGLPAVLLTRKVGSARTVALRDFDAAVAGLPVPEELASQEVSDASDSPAVADMAPPVQRLYARGRAAWLAGEPFDAIGHLQDALELAPEHPAVLRLVGTVYLSGFNPQRGRAYLSRAVRQNPGDAVSLYHLARVAQKDSDWPRVVALTHRALQHADSLTDPALPTLLHHLAGIALLQTEHEAAGIDQLERAQAGLTSLGRTTAFMPHLVEVYRNRALNLLLIGDAHHRLGQPPQARAAYAQVAALGHDDAISLVQRIVYTELRLGEGVRAVGVALALVERQEADDASLALLRYAVEAAGPLTLDAEALETIDAMAERLDYPPTFAVVVSQMLPHAVGRDRLMAHLQRRPADEVVFTTLLERLFSRARVPDADLIALAAACRNIFAADAALAVRYSEQLATAAGSHAGKLGRLMLEGETPAAGNRYAAAVLLLHGGEPDAALRQFELAVKDDTTLEAQRAAFGQALLDRGATASAASLVAAAPGQADEAMVQLHARVLAAEGDNAAAATLMRQFAAEHAVSVDFMLQQAASEKQAGDAEAAARTLNAALEAHPTDGRVYERLLEVERLTLPDEAYQARSRSLLSQLLQKAPQSRFARLVVVHNLIRRGENERAEAIIRTLLVEDPDDGEARRLLVHVLVEQGQLKQAEITALEWLSRDLEAEATRDLVAHFYLLAGRRSLLEEQFAAALDYADRGLAYRSQRVGPLLVLAGNALHRLDRFDAFDARVTEARSRTDLPTVALAAATVYSQFGDDARHDALLLEALKAQPQHAQLNNALGYTWADRGIRLAEAERMIRIAVDSDPENAAYLDSLAWVLYKRSRFTDAMEPMRDAVRHDAQRDPTLLAHHGDLHWRLGNAAEAARAWETARERLTVLREQSPMSNTLQTLASQVDAKLRAVEAGTPPPIAPVAAEPTDR